MTTVQGKVVRLLGDLVVVGEGGTDLLRSVFDGYEGEYVTIKVEQHDCERHLEPVESPANATDWSGSGSSQGYTVYKCKLCGHVWGCRYQYDAGTGADDHWHDFGLVEPETVKRHY